MLGIYKRGNDLELHTDASKYGFGAMLMQKNDLNEFHPFHYWSHKTSPGEPNYTSYELEVCAIVKVIKKFRIYLEGVKFKVVTDCIAFKQSIDKKETTSTRLNKWFLVLAGFEFVVEHRKANAVRHVDCLFRCFAISSEEDLLIEKVKTWQMKDQNLKKIMDKSKSKTNVKNYNIVDDLLYYKLDGNSLLVIPEVVEEQIFKVVHGIGHYGIRKMKHQINVNYHILNLDKK